MLLRIPPGREHIKKTHTAEITNYFYNILLLGNASTKAIKCYNL